MEQSVSSSKVTVEYIDPSGIYPLISGELQQYLPLRNLYWNSSARPLRSIASLHIEFVQDGQLSSQDKSFDGESEASKSAPGTNNHLQPGHRPGSGMGAKKERRHQIPGLRQTPYLKIYLLRCDDVDSYRNTARKQLREWVRENSPPSRSSTAVNTQEFHDAFEWLIVHVVLLDDGQARSRTANNSKGDSRLSLRGSTAVVEKLRADFNGTSKATVNRVAQVRIARISDTTHPSGPQTQGFSSDWEEFISKVKTLILLSFDLRVTQYEEDIKEKDSQRNLPGWNFNTFFVLKEGLARGFESVGLVEDALAGYRELAVGLNSVLEGKDLAGQPKGHFKDCTDDLSAELKRALQYGNVESDEKNTQGSNLSNGLGRTFGDLGSDVLSTGRKPYRELILANEISALDFRCYVFAREISLLLRLAKVTGDAKIDGAKEVTTFPPSEQDGELAKNSSEVEDHLLLAEVCRQSVAFLASVAQTIRDDLRSSIDPLSREHPGTVSKSNWDGPIEEIVASWTYSACQSILEATAVNSLTAQLHPLLQQLKGSSDHRQDHQEKVQHGSRGHLPSRTSSLSSNARIPPRSSSHGQFPAISTLDAIRMLPPASPHAGASELAAERAELVILKRRILSGVGRRQRRFNLEFADVLSLSQPEKADLEEVQLEKMTVSASNDSITSTQYIDTIPASSIQNHELRQSIESMDTYNIKYEDLTMSALALCVLADRRKSAEGLTADLAAVRFQMNDFSSAASYFHQIASFYSKNQWTRLENPMLQMYLRCLEKLDRKQEFARVGLQLLANIAREQRSSSGFRSNSYLDEVAKTQCLKGVIHASKFVQRLLSVSLADYFTQIQVDSYISHFENRDGFRLFMQLQNLMSEAFEAQDVRIRIVGVEEEQNCEIWLAAESPQHFKPGWNMITLSTTKTHPAVYKLDKIFIQSEKIIFCCDSATSANPALFRGSVNSDESDPITKSHSSPILVWPMVKALDARLLLCRTIHLEKPRSIEVLISSGWNKITKGNLTLRCGSAGLRLHTADADVPEGQTVILDKSQPGSIVFGALDTESKALFRIPYGLESDLKEITIKMEVSYTVNGQDFLYICSDELRILLPLSVNVQDTFKERTLFSRFTVGTATSIPAKITNYEIRNPHDFSVTVPLISTGNLDIFVRQPLSIVAKIQRNDSSKSKSTAQHFSDPRLTLVIDYSCVDQELDDAVEKQFSFALREGHLERFSRLLIPKLIGMLRSRLSLSDYEAIALFQESTTGSFHELNWSSVMFGLASQDRELVHTWLMDWHAKNTALSLPSSSDVGRHRLLVPVELPQMPVVITARLDLSGCASELEEASAATVDQALPAELVIKHSRYWASGPNSVPADEAVEIAYEIQANPDNWLVGGQRKAHFFAKEDETSRFSVVLIPQKSGHLLYPSIEVRAGRTRSLDSTSMDGHRASSVALDCEMDYWNQGESLLVVPNLSSATWSLELGSAGGRAWLVESRSRPPK